MESFLDKGRMQPLLEAIPVKIVLNEDSGLFGAARFTLLTKGFRSLSNSIPRTGRRQRGPQPPKYAPAKLARLESTGLP